MSKISTNVDKSTNHVTQENFQHKASQKGANYIPKSTINISPLPMEDEQLYSPPLRKILSISKKGNNQSNHINKATTSTTSPNSSAPCKPGPKSMTTVVPATSQHQTNHPKKVSTGSNISYSCNICNKVFGHRSSLYKHTTSCHPENPTPGKIKCQEEGCTFTCRVLSQFGNIFRKITILNGTRR